MLIREIRGSDFLAELGDLFAGLLDHAGCFGVIEEGEVAFFVGQMAAFIEEAAGGAAGMEAVGKETAVNKTKALPGGAGQFVLGSGQRALMHFLGQIPFEPVSFLYQRPDHDTQDKPDAAPVEEERCQDEAAADGDGEIVPEVEEYGRTPAYNRCGKPDKLVGRQIAHSQPQTGHTGKQSMVQAKNNATHKHIHPPGA